MNAELVSVRERHGMDGRATRVGRVAVLAMLSLTVTACEWFTDFKRQPSVKPWGAYSADSAELKGFRGQPAGSVPTHGALAPAYAVSYSSLNLATLDSFSTLANPVAPDGRSLANGRMYFQVTCAVCHGDLGDGNSALRQMNPNYGFAPSLVADVTKNRADGYIWGMMRNGRNLMPPANRIGEMERWDVVNYVRGLQGKYAVITGPVGRPGETGDKLPGATRDAPTVPVKYFHPVVHPRPARAHGAEPAGEGKKPEGKP